jgi:hypothetical protein
MPRATEGRLWLFCHRFLALFDGHRRCLLPIRQKIFTQGKAMRIKWRPGAGLLWVVHALRRAAAGTHRWLDPGRPIQWCRSGNPVLLAEAGAVRGVCGPTDVIRALATSDARSRAQS